MGGLLMRFFPLAVAALSCPLIALPPRVRLRPPTEPAAAESERKVIHIRFDEKYFRIKLLNQLQMCFGGKFEWTKQGYIH